MRTLHIISVLFFLNTCPAMAQDKDDPGYDPSEEWVGDGDNEWHDGRPTVQEMEYSMSPDGFFEIKVVLSEPITSDDEVCVRGTWEGNYVEMTLPFAKGPEEDLVTTESTGRGFSQVTLEPTGTITRGAHYKWHFENRVHLSMVDLELPYGEQNSAVFRATQEFDPRIHTIPAGGWVCDYGRARPTGRDNDRFGTVESYQVTSITASDDEVRIETDHKELDIHHQQDGSIFSAGQFELRHAGAGEAILKAVRQDDNGHMRPVMSGTMESLTKSTPKVTVVFTRGARMAVGYTFDVTGKDGALIGEIDIGRSSRMSEVQVSLELPLGSYAYEFWTEGGTLVLRALSRDELTAGML